MLSPELDGGARETRRLYAGVAAILEIARDLVRTADGKLSQERGPEWQRMYDALAEILELARLPHYGDDPAEAWGRLAAVAERAERGLPGPPGPPLPESAQTPGAENRPREPAWNGARDT